MLPHKYLLRAFKQINWLSSTYTLKYSISNSEKLKQILQKIQVVSDSNKKLSLQDSGFIEGQHIDQSTKKVSIALKLSKDYPKIKNVLKNQLEKEGFKNVDITLAPKTQQQKFNRKGNLTSIKKIIAVSSCKGGVGKSTVAINVAATLKNQGFKVGIFDADIYGPSLPTLINKEAQYLTPRQSNGKQIQPILYQDIKCMSFGFVGQKAIMRGPMVSSIISQLLYQTHWGQLDYLVIDMPPGTGDIQLSLCQQLKFDGAIIVTTPQRLSFIDVIKGIEMFQDLRVRIVGIVQNMSHYECSHCNHQELIFGRGYAQMLMDQFGIENTIRIPLISQISKYSDLGTPLAFVLPSEHKLMKSYNSLCTSVTQQVSRQHNKIFIFWNTTNRKIVFQDNGKKKQIDPYVLRTMCRCAGCVDELSGAMILKKEEIDPEVYPTKIEEKGNYAVAVVWSDGHRSSIYPYKRFQSDEIPSS